MKHSPTAKKIVALLPLFIVATFAGIILTSCETEQPASNPADPGVFKFTVLKYPVPQPVAVWDFDPSQYANPEGTALNIATCIVKGDVDHWLAAWTPAERPALSKEDRDALLQKWQPLKNGKILLEGNVVAGADIVVDLYIRDNQQKEQKIQLPLKREQSQWWLSKIDADSEYLNWESSSNKIVAIKDPIALRTYLDFVNKAAAMKKGQSHP